VIEELASITKPIPPKLPTDHRIYYLGLARNTYTTWDQIRYTAVVDSSPTILPNGLHPRDTFTLYEATVRRTRRALQSHAPSKGPHSWATETDDTSWDHWQPKWPSLYTFPHHPQSSYFMWRMYHHGTEVADRLGDYVPDNHCFCGEVETISHAYSECPVAIDGWRMLNTLALGSTNTTFGPLETPTYSPQRLKALLKGLPNTANEGHRDLLTLLTYSLLMAIERHRYEVIFDNKPPSSRRLEVHFASSINANITGLHHLAYSFQLNPDMTLITRQRERFKSAFVATGLCAIGHPPTHNLLQPSPFALRQGITMFNINE